MGVVLHVLQRDINREIPHFYLVLYNHQLSRGIHFPISPPVMPFGQMLHGNCFPDIDSALFLASNSGK